MTLDLLEAKVGHERLTPKKNRFAYSLFYIVSSVTDATLPTPSLFTFERFNVLSMYAKDHGSRNGESGRAWIQGQCANHSLALAPDDEVLLIAHPRLFGFAFNPISYWLVFEKATYLKAVVCEVHNTFGDTHNYFLAHSDHRAIGPDHVFTAKKNLYVSPFNTVAPGSYEFTFTYSDTSFSSVINYFENGTHILNTYMGGKRQPLTNARILSCVLKYPLMTLHVVFRIHWQALILYLKGVIPTLRSRPAPTRGGTTAGMKKTDA